MKRLLLLNFTFFLTLATNAQWLPINPGAGGQVQDVVGDPSTPGVLYLASDMEGVYKTTNNGESWHITGQLLHNRVYAVTIDPNNSNRLYIGTLFGLHTSDDGGNTYNFVQSTRNKTIASASVDPNNSSNVIVGAGWRDDYDFATHLGEKTAGKGIIYKTTDGGVNWTEIIFDDNQNADRNVWNISYNIANSSEVYIGSSIGIFKSIDGGDTWAKLDNPSGATKNRGISLSPDGTELYATFDNSGKLYATPTESISWQKVMEGDGIKLQNFQYWYPEVDPRSTGSTHKLLVGMQGQREGLFEGTFEWSGNALTSYSWDRVWSDDGGWDRGWDYATPNARYAHYTPATWDRALWSTTNQTIYEAVPDGDGYKWNNKYCTPNYDFEVPSWGTTFPTYSGRGTESTYTYDIAVHENYVIQGQGDNGFMESWDYGFSWSNMQHRQNNINLSDVQAVDIADAWGVPVVVAQATSGYGGNAKDGRFFVKKLVEHSPNDEWKLLGAGRGRLLGIGSGILRDIAVSPANPAKVFMFSTGNGMYMIEDIGKTLDYQSKGKTLNAKKISNGDISGAGSAKKISPHPTNEDIVFFNSSSGSQGVFKGVNNDGKWTWTKIYNGYGWDSEVHSWEHNGQVYLMYAGFASGDQGDGSHTIVALSLDEGKTWEIVFNKEMAKELRSVPWYAEWEDIYTFKTKGGPAAYGNTMIVNYYHHGYQLGYGMFKGTIQTDNTVTWEDYTGDLHFPGPTSAIFAETKGKIDFYVSTAGAGAWKRPHSDAPATPQKPEKPTGLGVVPKSSSEIELGWSDNSDNETGFRIERKKDNGSFEVVAQVGRESSRYLDTGLDESSEYAYRLMAFNKGGTSEYSDEASTSTLDGRGTPCDNPNIIGLGDFKDEDTGWELYNNGEATSTASVVDHSGFADNKAVNINIASIHNGGDSDIQYFYAFDMLEGDTPYTLTFKAKSTANKPIRISVLKNEAPWTGYLTENINLSTSVKKYGPFSFTTDESINNVRLDFFLGEDDEDVWFDEIELRSAEICMIYDVESVSIDNCSDSIEKGETLSLTATVLPEDATDKSITWSSSDEDVLTVNEEGLVTAVSSGLAIITLKSNSNDLAQQCEINVPLLLGNIEAEHSKISIYPNPSNGAFFVNFGEKPTEKVEMKLTTLLGNTVKQRIFLPSQQININGLSKGLYILSLHSSKLQFNSKVLIQ